jgi:hypothetical protein
MIRKDASKIFQGHPSIEVARQNEGYPTNQIYIVEESCDQLKNDGSIQELMTLEPGIICIHKRITVYNSICIEL